MKKQKQLYNLFTLLNAFGNAKTNHNPDSSCYSKYCELQFDGVGKFLGGQLLPYLLEKHKVVSIQPGERNFHAFYYLLSGADSSEKNQWGLMDASKFSLLSKSNCIKVPEIDDKAEFENLKKAMKMLGLNSKFQRNIWQLLAAVLYLGNIEFIPNNFKTQQSQEATLVKNPDIVDFAAELLGLDGISLENIFLTQSIMVKKELCTQFLEPKQAMKIRDSFVKSIYSLLFNWLVEFVNSKICDEGAKHSIGIVDFTGVSNFESENGFEEFFVNFANEKIYEFYNRQIFENTARSFAQDDIAVEIPKNSEMKARRLLYTHETKGLLNIIHEESLKPETKDVDLVAAFNSANSSNSEYIIPQPVSPSHFGINHYSSRVIYDIEGFVEKNRDYVSSDVVSLVRGGTHFSGSKNTFLVGLFNEESLVIEKQLNKDRIISVKQENKPQRLPTNRAGNNNEELKEKQEEITIASQIPTILKELFDFMNGAAVHFVICASPSKNEVGFDGQTVIEKIKMYNFVPLIQMMRLNFYYKSDFDNFLKEFSVLSPDQNQQQSPQDRTQVLVESLEIPSDGYMITPNRIYFKTPAFRLLQEAFYRKLASTTIRRESSFYGGKSETAHGHRFSIHEEPTRKFSFIDDDGASVADSELTTTTRDSKFNRDDSVNAILLNNLKDKLLTEKKAPEKLPEPEKKVLTFQRKLWLAFTAFSTWWVPARFMAAAGMKNPDVQLAWREKVALCVLIAILSGLMLFYIVGFTSMICPPQKVMTMQELVKKPTNQPNIVVRGKVYELTEFAFSHVVNKATEAMIYDMAGLNASPMFPRKTCNIELTEYNPNCTVAGRTKTYSFCHVDTFMYQELEKYFVADVGFSLDEVKVGNSPSNALILISDRVYNVSTLVAGNTLTTKGQKVVMTAPWGIDKTSQFNYDGAAADLRCLADYRIGIIDRRQGVNCIIADWILIGSTGLVVAVMVFKFLAALQLGSKREPEDLDKFVILQVPCYTEGEDSLRKTIDSLAQLRYDDKRKLLFIVADGMIIGSGNDRPTPRIVLDILGVDPEIDPEALPFISISEGNKQHNMGKVYSGLYEAAGHRVPFIVIVKVGKSTERSRPGNRGKRDSQMVLLKFLNKVHYDLPMTPMELAIYKHIKNVIGVDPGYYEYILMVDADTEVLPDSLNRLVACMLHDTQIMGLCGETQISNEKDTWITMIQVYEYYISHHLAKAFESLFGSVTCLPGCFCMYRVKTATKQTPLIIHNSILDEYSVCEVDTLHKKNLLSLGEDRFLTTLMMKYFPECRLKFTPDAVCLTVVPDRWSVLLSQRRRWINSTIHNLFELLLLPQLCGFCCFSMRFVVFLDLFATLVMPVTVGYLGYLIYQAIASNTAPIISIIMIAIAYGMQVVIFLLKRQWQHIGWMVIYIFAMPIFNVFIPLYAFWHFDDFSWGNTRRVLGEKAGGHGGDEEKFDPSLIPLKKWSECENDPNEAWETASHRSASSRRSTISKRTHQSKRNDSFHAPSVAKHILEPMPMKTSMSQTGFSRPASAHSGIHAMSEYGGYTPEPMSQRKPLLSEQSKRSSRVDSNMGFNQPMFSNFNDGFSDQPRYPTQDEMIAFLREFLSSANLMTVTKKQVREEMSAYFQVDLSPFKEFINETIELILQGRL